MNLELTTYLMIKAIQPQMTIEIITMILQWIIGPLVGAIFLWLVWLTMKLIHTMASLGVNTALDKQTQLALVGMKTEINGLSSEVKELNNNMLKIMVGLHIK